MTITHVECTYDQPSNRRRNPAPQYIEALEARLHKVEALLRIVAPDIDMDDPKFDVLMPQQILASRKTKKNPSAVEPSEPNVPVNTESGDESLLESMMENTGALDLDDQGHWDYHGQSSGLIFMRRFREQFKDLAIADPKSFAKTKPLTQVLESPMSLSDSPKEALVHFQDLPPKEIAKELCKNALEQACSLMRFAHQPTFYAMLDRIYDKPPELYGNEENKFLPLLYVVLAVGCLFENAENSRLDISGYQGAIEQG